MIPKTTEKSKALKLRRAGYTYGEILRQVPVAKSTLSLWLREVGLSRKTAHVLTQKKILAAQRGGDAKRKQRIQTEEAAEQMAKKDIRSIGKRDLWLIGVALYWAEGSKAKPWSPSVGISFTNSDPLMVKVFIRWLNECLLVPTKKIKYRLYLHESHKHRLVDVQNIWQYTMGLSKDGYRGVTFKKGSTSSSKRKNIGDAYIGLVQISVNRSTLLNRRIAAWTARIAELALKGQ